MDGPAAHGAAPTRIVRPTGSGAEWRADLRRRILAVLGTLADEGLPMMRLRDLADLVGASPGPVSDSLAVLRGQGAARRVWAFGQGRRSLRYVLLDGRVTGWSGEWPGLAALTPGQRAALREAAEAWP